MVVSSVDEPLSARQLADTAERFAGMADTAELMGDDAGAARFRVRAAEFQQLAMRLLDG